MKNRRILMGALAVALVFGLVFAGCEQATDDEEEENMNSEGKYITVKNITDLTGRAGIWVFKNLPEGNNMPVNEAICSSTIRDNEFSTSLAVPRNNTYVTTTGWTGSGKYYVVFIPIVNNDWSEEGVLIYVGSGGNTPVQVDFNETETTLEYSEFKPYTSS
jgi:hypothetical protein